MIVYTFLQILILLLFLYLSHLYFNYLLRYIHFNLQDRRFLPFLNNEQYDPDHASDKRFIFGLPLGIIIFPFAISFTASLAFRYITDSVRNENLLKEERMATLTSELSLLKSQVSPHFLFNILNTMVFLARKKSSILESSLLKLSSLLRYMLYDTDTEKVLLEKEVKYLDDYINLQKIRYHDLKVEVFFNNEDEDFVIAPMLLIPFVENAFKHAGSFIDDHSFIKIEVLTKSNTLFFGVCNKYTESKPEQKDNASGIGLANVTKRLDLLYKNNYRLSIEKMNNIFTVALQINLEKKYETQMHSHR